MQRVSILFIGFFIFSTSARAGHPPDSLYMSEDTVVIKKNEILILDDTVFAPTHDTTVVIDDRYHIKNNPYRTSDSFTRKVKDYLGNQPLTKELLNLIYINKGLNYEKQRSQKFRTSNAPFEPYRNLEITDIQIKKVDVLEGSVYDTSRIASSRVVRLANKFHVKTWNSVIRNNLTLQKGEKLDPYKIADNERQLRRLRFIEDAKIYVSGDSIQGVRLLVVVKDRLSLGIDGNLRSANRFDLELFTRSIGGSGQFASGSWLYDAQKSPQSGYQFSIGGQNINRMISSWRINHLNFGDQKIWGLSLEKEFVSPDIKYGGGLNIRSIQDTRLVLDGESAYEGNFHLNSQDIWVGRSFKVFNKRARINLTIAARLLNHQFEHQPQVSRDSNFLFYERKMVLGEISLSQQKFIKANYVLGFGIAEDIPNGFKVSLQSGQDFNEFYTHSYFGARIFKSFYINKLGYIYSNIDFGTFYKGRYEHGVFNTGIGYFSPLVKTNNFFIRNFLFTNFVRGIRQDRTRTLNLEQRVRDANFHYEGNTALTVRVESVVFTPLYLMGFRFAPFFFYTNVQIWESRSEPQVSRAFQGAGFGIRMKNESLVFDTFELRGTKYLSHPSGGDLFFELSASTPIAFERVFRFKPLLLPFN